MFFLHEIERIITIHPSFLGAKIDDIIDDRLKRDVEGIQIEDFFIICVMDAKDLSAGRVLPGTGYIEYKVHFKAVVWKPFRGEILDGIVSSVSEMGILVDIGPLETFVSQTMIPSSIKFDGNATPQQWTDNSEQVIEKGTHLRMKIKGLRTELGRMYAVATIKEDYLGPLGG
ncbi:DNA-directed RNA polymerase II 19 kDa polypeptide [Saccharata proteae CBS 121410]|uniref:DNA-directed RNA polymerase subunit n=1 Tax=Saccharata proteae CBS 121410 TaxID=1314787 RepID=A0A9P4HWP3_9PEZI|nr:DNA-directed RNA polymerase II 19 kDa polypeptide [Saccharata proteae CBS 121410]